jgi:ABC-type nitrate/sulfonate/bicarbonate transport system substrate-binding protein
MEASAPDRPLRVNTFLVASNLPLYVGQAKGFFKNRGIDMELQITPNSGDQREGLAAKRFDIALAAIDNAVALEEATRAGVIVIMGGDNGLNSLFAQPGIQSIQDLRGKTVIVDAPNTAYALLLYKMLKVKGLEREKDYKVEPIGGTNLRLEAMRTNKDYSATMLTPPFAILAEKEGFENLGLAVSVIGPYQANGAFVLKEWAQANAGLMEDFIRGYIESLRWALTPAHKVETVTILAKELTLDSETATRTYEAAVDPINGLAKDAMLDLKGFEGTLKLRAELEGQWRGTPPAAGKYYDLSYYERAVKGL